MFHRRFCRLRAARKQKGTDPARGQKLLILYENDKQKGPDPARGLKLVYFI